VEYDKKGKLIKTIVLPTYRPPTHEEFKEMEQERLNNISLANRTFEDTRRSLYQALQDSSTRPSDIVILNRDVQKADTALQKIRYPMRAVHREGGIKIRELDFDQLQETRVFPYMIAFSNVRPFTLQEQYVRLGDVALPPMVSVAEAKAAEAAQAAPEVIVLFSDQDMDANPYGFLALSWPVSIPFQERIYPSARHAIFAELAREFGDEERAAQFQTAESGSDIRYSIDDVTGGRDVNQSKWDKKLNYLINMVNVLKFKQYPELAQRLMDIPSPSVIGAYEPNDMQIGIGLSLDNVKAKDKATWTGKNLLGKSLMKIRDLLLEERGQLMAQSIKPKRSKPKSSAAKKDTAVTLEPSVSTTSGMTLGDLTPNQPMLLPNIPAASMAAVPMPEVSAMAAPMPEVSAMAAPIASTPSIIRKGPRVAMRPAAPQ
jgi:ribA/ribD-fused uncharacterized protein